MDEMDENPFRPPDDEEVFKMREEERQAKQTQRHKLRNMKVWEKTTQSSRMGRTRRLRDIEGGLEDTAASRQARHTSGLVAAATAAISHDHRSGDRNSLTAFIASKRQLFLLLAGLEVKRSEIRKLEQRAAMKEEALKKSELMLEEDAIRFDAFLKENDKKAHEAIKNAEREAKLKADKMQEIKRLKHSIHVVMNEKSKLQEVLNDCLKYKEFLDSLTPEEWVNQQKADKAKRQEERRRARFETDVAAWEAMRANKEAELAHQAEEARKKAQKEGRLLKRNSVAPSVDALLPPCPELEHYEVESSGEELPMYFQQPSQLLALFSALEESNLFLITNCQQTEQQLEELKQTYVETHKKMQKQTQALQASIQALESQIAKEKAKADSLGQRVQDTAGEDGQEQLLKALRTKVKQVYKSCGFESDANPDLLSMLTDLEGLLEDLLSEISAMRPEYVRASEKALEKLRRERVRAARMKQQQQIYEMRLKKSMERSQAPAKKKLGKQVMFRSPPLRKRVRQKTSNTKDDQEAEDLKYLT